MGGDAASEASEGREGSGGGAAASGGHTVGKRRLAHRPVDIALLTGRLSS